VTDGPAEVLRRVPGPFRVAVAEKLLDGAELTRLAGWFHVERWIRHTDVFYRCDIAVVPPERSHGLAERLRAEVARVLQLDLGPHLQVTAQRMGPGDGSDVHTDRPAAGFEAVRLVVQLDEAPHGGGVFRAFDDRGSCWLERPPAPGRAVAFELSARSHHDVTGCRTPRRSVVFHYWHRGNPPDAGERLAARFAGLSFGALPPSLDEAMSAAEARYDDEVTWRAGTAAWWAHTEGHDEQQVAAVYAAALPMAAVHPLARRACWWVDLWRDGFDRRRWEEHGRPQPHGR